MKAHKYWSLGALVAMIGTFYPEKRKSLFLRNFLNNQRSSLYEISFLFIHLVTIYIKRDSFYI